jgi:hypothetical protein
MTCERGRSIESRTISLAAIVVGLLLLDGAVVVDEDERAVVLGVNIARGALVAGAQVALRVVGWEGRLGGAFLLSSTNC